MTSLMGQESKINLKKTHMIRVITWRLVSNLVCISSTKRCIDIFQ